MSSISGQDIEHRIIDLFPVGTSFSYAGHQCDVIRVGKPSSRNGEPKTDVYIGAVTDGGRDIELKISCKKDNARFLENKLTAERASEIFGDEYASRLRHYCDLLTPRIVSRQKVFTQSAGKTEPGITLGWRADIMMGRTSGTLSTKLDVTTDELLEMYSGSNLPQEKRDAMVDGKMLHDSGVANQYYQASDVPDTPQEVINRLVKLDDYVREERPEVCIALKAVNYRIDKDKYEKRPLAIMMTYDVDDGMLRSHVNVSDPLRVGSAQSYRMVRNIMRECGIYSSADLSEHVDEQTNESDVDGRHIRPASYSAGRIWVDSYTKSDGTQVSGYWRNA